MTNSGMLLSIVVPVYNVEPYVGSCLRSILETDADASRFELIVVNDGTKDNSAAIASEICGKYQNATLISQENRGLSAARMTGLSSAKGRYVWFVDSDDWLEADAVRTVLDMLENEAADVLITPLRWRYDNGEGDYTDIVVADRTTMSGKDYLRSGKYVVCAAQRYIYRKSAFDPKWTFFPEGLLHEDEYFSRVLLYQTETVQILDKCLYNYRQRPKSIMSGKSVSSANDIVSIYKLLELFNDACVFADDKEWFGKRCAEVLFLSYCHSADIFGSKEFKGFLKENRGFILKTYYKYSFGQSFKKIAGDMTFLLSPKQYTKHFALRYITFS